MNAGERQILALRNVTKRYRTDTVETSAIDGVSLSIGVGEFVSIVGRSGSGKSTLLSIIGLLEKPTEGDCLVDGVSTADLSPRQLAQLRNRHFGFVFQSCNLIDHLTVLENVMLPMDYRPRAERVSPRKGKELLDRLGIPHRAGHLPRQLSGGEQQRAATARALIGSPSLLLADEPTGNLDTENAEIVLGILDELHRDGATICMVTHNPEEAARASRIIRLSDGRLAGQNASA